MKGNEKKKETEWKKGGKADEKSNTRLSARLWARTSTGAFFPRKGKGEKGKGKGKKKKRKGGTRGSSQELRPWEYLLRTFT